MYRQAKELALLKAQLQVEQSAAKASEEARAQVLAETTRELVDVKDVLAHSTVLVREYQAAKEALQARSLTRDISVAAS